MLQGNAGVFEACVNALSEPQKLAIRTVLAWASHTWSTTIISWQYIIIERKEYILCRVYARNKYKFFIEMAFSSNTCDWTNIMHVVVMESLWKLNINEICWRMCIVWVNSLETNKDWHCKLWPRLLLRSRWISKSIGRGKRKGKWRVGEQVGTAVYLAQTPLTPLSLAVPPEGRARALM